MEPRDLRWWKRAAGLGTFWQRIRRLVPFCTLILRFHVEAAQRMPAERRRALELQLARNLEKLIGERRCEECGGMFAPHRHGGPVQRFCSTGCQRRAAKRRDYTKRLRRSTHWGEERRCTYCGARFQCRRDDHRFCSLDCRQGYHRHRVATP